MKRFAAILAATVLFLSLIPVRAALAEAVIARSGYDGFSDMPGGLCAVGDSL